MVRPCLPGKQGSGLHWFFGSSAAMIVCHHAHRDFVGNPLLGLPSWPVLHKAVSSGILKWAKVLVRRVRVISIKLKFVCYFMKDLKLLTKMLCIYSICLHGFLCASTCVRVTSRSISIGFLIGQHAWEVCMPICFAFPPIAPLSWVLEMIHPRLCIFSRINIATWWRNLSTNATVWPTDFFFFCQ